MQRCLQLAELSLGDVAPNPLVGAVLVCEGKIVSEGRHRFYGGPHAEVEAIKGVEDAILQKSTLYVNLEPCAHHGKTPPCANLIIEKKIPRVVIGCRDSYSEVNGKGIELLKNAGIEVSTGVLETECRLLNRRFFTFHEKKRPFIILKWAESLDGKMTAATGERTLISGNAANMLVHQWRAHEQAIMVGTNTVKVDDPFLTTRNVLGSNPLRLVLDKNLELSSSNHVFNNDAPTLVFNSREDKAVNNIGYIKINSWDSPFEEIWTHLHQKNIQSVLVEGGQKLLSSLLSENTWDELRILKSKHKIIGEGLNSPNYIGERFMHQETTEDLIYYFKP